MGSLYDITCERCPAVTTVSEGYGFQNSRSTFEYLFLNILTKSERGSLSEILPEGFESKVSRVNWSRKAFTCTSCSKLGCANHWSITLAGGETYEREPVCSCGGKQELISLHSEGDIDANCPACGAHSLKATLSGMWD